MTSLLFVPKTLYQRWQRMAGSTGKEPQPKKKRLSLSWRRFEIWDEKSIEEAKKAFVPKNTQKATLWAANVFDQWLQEHNELSDNKCPLDVLLKSNPKILCHWLCVFVSEVKKTDGEDYTPRRINQSLASLQRSMNEKRSLEDNNKNLWSCKYWFEKASSSFGSSYSCSPR